MLDISYVSRRFALYSLIGTLSLSLFLPLTEPFSFNITDLFLASIFGGALAGLGIGLAFRSKGSLGGLEIIAVLFKRFRGYAIGDTFFCN